MGDIVEPELKRLELLTYRGQPIFEKAISLRVYPPEAIFAEKLETLLSKGATNSRMKDYHDLFLLTQTKNLLDQTNLKASIAKTFKQRGTELKLPIQFKEEDYEFLQNLWARHLKGLGETKRQLQLPKEIKTIIESLNQFL